MLLRVSGSKGLRRERRLNSDGSVSVGGSRGCDEVFLFLLSYQDSLDTKVGLFRDRQVHT